MAINLTLELASGQSLQGAPLELLVNGAPVARATVDQQGRVAFDAKPAAGKLAVRVDRSILNGR
ncbi:hypothetical protein [Pseudomonas chlororaphis]|uniref:hypothetical protein n=1 Tax=Pseudomonas chlororaphis TaxID=587753 RepID=UPI0003D344C3|nr:hypothetical protein [Pseudomonas chlororaphis]AZD27655.1 hypothetical protein C4K23_0886 [Pseudomonas chlororaphis]ETD35756.1 hypothetical protein U724_24320 [Pseudomonas chlororaphis subsp. aurantiaca PB-St2]QFS53248.1 hypothetical protein FD951_01360 [Pseudomonas chlororaphis subsp. aurantiaca]